MCLHALAAPIIAISILGTPACAGARHEHSNKPVNIVDVDDQLVLKDSAMTRPKLTGLRRNLAIAIGNSGDEAALAELRRERDDQPSAADPMVRAHIESDFRYDTAGKRHRVS